MTTGSHLTYWPWKRLPLLTHFVLLSASEAVTGGHMKGREAEVAAKICSFGTGLGRSL